MESSNGETMLRHLPSYALAFACITSLAQSQQVVNVWPGTAPGSEGWTRTESKIDNTPVGRVLFNVVTPTLTAYLPKGKASGTGVIIAPGGAFVALPIDIEATDAAKWLQAKGIAAFVLKYRLIAKLGNDMNAPPELDLDTAGRYAMADGIQALKVVREHAAEWRVDPNRIGFMGFSAGAMVATAALVNPDAGARPNFAALIYGAPYGALPTIPAKLPPIFMAWAQDDLVGLETVVRFHRALITSGSEPEAHIFNAGGHGFGMKRQGTSSDHWIDELYYWLDAHGLTRR
ncbi:MAG: alpha/beta hydrolase [Gemmatimonadaceae bacterium]